MFDPRTDDLGELAEEMSARRGELVATDEPTVGSKPFLDAIMMEDGQSDGCFPNSSCTDEGDWGEVFCEADDVLDQLLTSEKDSRGWGRRFTRHARSGCEILDLFVTGVADLF